MTLQILLPRLSGSLSVLSLGAALAGGWAAAAENAVARPYVTGSHQQLVRTFHTTATGLPADHVRALTVTSNGTVLVSAGKAVARLENDRWLVEPGPAEVTALLGASQAGEALAGGTNGVWIRAAGKWERDENGPVNAIAFAAEPDGTPWVIAPSGVWRRAGGWKHLHDFSDAEVTAARSLLPTGPEDVFMTSDTGMFGLMGKRKYWMPLEVLPGSLLSPNTRGLARLDRDFFLVATDQGLNLTDGLKGWQSFTGADGLPVLDLTVVAVAPDGTVWLGSDQGLIRWQAGAWTYLASKRWLPDNRVTAIAPATNGAVWVGTPKGLSHIQHRQLTLLEKAAILQRDLESRDRRHGYVTILQLRAPGVVEGAQQEISDNDGLWTSLYVAAESFRYAVTKSPEAKTQAVRSLKALLRLESITRIPGFPARAICHTNEPPFAQRSLRSDPEWHPSPVEPGWYWKGETSSDELDGHYFGWYLFYELAANDEEKRAVRATCKRVTDHILDHGYYLVDHDGKPTTWGVWAPEKLNDDPKWWSDRALNSLEILSHLRVAMHLVGDPRYERAYRELIRQHHYALNTFHPKIPGGVSHDDQLLFLSYYPLLQLEHEPALRGIYIASLRQAWEPERIEANPLWNFIYGASTGEPCEVEAAVGTLREIPLDFISWRMRNSHRADLAFDPVAGRRGMKRLLKPLPFAERVIHNWDSDPYQPDGGSDLGEADQTVWLLPYWMGRFHGLIE